MLNIYTQEPRLLTSHLLIITLLIKLCHASLFCNTTTNICQPCYYRCRTCKGTASADCLQCMPEYVLANGECLACGMYCASCATETGDVWERFYMGALRCETCMAGYYLSQARGVCLNCPTGALQCTLSSIQTCKPGYSISNGICSQCPENCLSCPTSNPSTCQQCSLGYYLSPSSSSLNMFCTKCSIQNCENCDSASNCVQCSSGYSGTLCTQFAPCVSRCKICYLNQCLLCQSGFFVYQGQCLPLGVLCSQIGGSGLSDCGQCQPFAYLSQSKCLPHYSISDTQTQTYLTPSTLNLNSQATVSYMNSTCIFKNLEIKFLNQITTGSNQSTSKPLKNKFVVDIENQLPFFAFDAIVRLVVPDDINNSDFVTIDGVKNVIGKDYLSCVAQDQTKYRAVNLQFSVKMSEDFNVSSYSFIKNNHQRNGFSLTIQCPNCSTLGLSQLLIQFQHCMISKCQTCTSAYICKSCFYPYLLQDNACIQQCSSGYYLTSQTATCSYDCLDGYYPILEDYLCIACLVPCLRCWGNQSYQCYDCVHGWYFDAKQGTCVTVCGIGSYGVVGVSGAVCESCLYPCNSCQINNTRCTSCTTGYLVQAQHYCSYTCPKETYLSVLQICTPCISPCSQCLNQNECLSCTDSYFYLNSNNSCLNSCPISTIPINEICVFCQYPCFQCDLSVDNCTTCTVGFLEGFKCVEVCTVGYYADQIYKKCSLCSNFCLKCLNLTTCLECQSPKYLFNNSCIQICPLSTYPSETSSKSPICIPCSPPCQTCVSKTHCLSCTNSLLIIFNYTCQSQCPPSTYMYLNSINNISQCKLCVNGCTQCLGQNQCLKCSSGYLMIVGQFWCAVLCPAGRFLWKGGQECILCVSPCLECLSYYECTTCADGYYYLAGQKKCYSECPLGYLVNITAKTCEQCSLSCQKCSYQQNHCLQCSSLTFKQPNSSFQHQNTLTFECKVSCPQTHYPQPILRACVPCQPPCRSCLTMKTCLTCLSSMPYLFNGQCLSDCPQGMFQYNFVCNQCDISCLICQHNANNCTGCSRGLYLLQSSVNQYQNGQCLTTCPSEFYLSSSHTCLPCQPPCQTCLTETLCQSCQPPYLLFASSCVQLCPNGYYISINSSTAACKICNNQCSSCQISPYNCTSCFVTNSYLLKGKKAESNQCVFSCPDNMYMDNRLRTCEMCSSSCKTCVENGVCSSCPDGFALVQFQCVNKCPDKYFIQNSTCIRCHDPCLTCQAELSCTSCVKPYLYISNTLMSTLSLSVVPCSYSCPNRTYPSSTSSTLQCLLCPPSCLQCHDYSSCKSCNTTSNRPYLQQTSCLGYCSPGYYPDNTTFTCQECPQNCVSCQSNSKCYQCVNAYLHRGVCVTECGDGFYGDASGACLICVQPCDRCFDSSNCLSCKPTYYLYQTFCLKHCPSEMWSYPQSQGCHQDCNLPYRDSANRMCYQRCPKYYNSEGECVNECTGLGQLQVLNSSLGCQRCHGTCPLTPYFKSFFVNFGDRHFIAVLFSVNVMGWQGFTQHYSYYVETQSQLLHEYLSIENAVTTSTSSVSPPRLLQVYYPTPTKTSPNMVLLQLADPPVSPQLSLTISSYQQIRYNSYPLQNKLVSMQVSSNYLTTNNYVWMTYFGQILGYIIMFLMAISLMLDNSKAIYGLVQVVQAAWVLRFLGIWWWVGLGEVMGGVGVVFKLGIKEISTAHIWDCGVKKIFYFNYCDYQYNLISISIFIGIFAVIAFIGKLIFMKVSPDRHKLIWSHINDFYWYFAFLVFFAAYDAPNAIFAPIVSLLGLLTILLWYQSIKNIFNNTYAESTFFFSLKKGKSSNPISNSVYPISLCRRLLLFLFISIDPSQQILILSLTTFATIFLIVNAMWNKPYKVYKILLPLNECLVGIFYFILEVFVVISKGVGNETWEISGWAVTALFLVIVVIGVAIGVRENVRIVRKIWGKYRKESRLQTGITEQIRQDKKNKEVDQEYQTPKFNEKLLQNMGRKPALKSTPTQSPVLSSYKKCSFPNQPSKHKQDSQKSNEQQLKLKNRNKYRNKDKGKEKDSMKIKNGDRITEQVEQYEDEEVSSYFEQSKGQSNYSSSLSLGFTGKGAAKYLVKVSKMDVGVNGNGTAMY